MQIIKGLDGELGAIGDQPASATFTDELVRLRELMPRSDAERRYWTNHSSDGTAALATRLQTWLDDNLQQPSAQPGSERKRPVTRCGDPVEAGTAGMGAA
jgi:hypothetical protein